MAIHNTVSKDRSKPIRAKNTSARKAQNRPGDREANKAQKRERIKLAARALFSKKGYDEATLRQIAQRAGVALGTLSLYTKDKRDLVLLMCNDEIAEMIERARGSVSDDADFLDNLIAYFHVFYLEFASDLNLSRAFLQLNFFSEGMNTAGFALNREHMLVSICEIVDLAKNQGALNPEEPSDFIARSIFYSYASAVRWWIAEDRPNVRHGLDHLRKLLRLQTDGYKAGVSCRAER